MFWIVAIVVVAFIAFAMWRTRGRGAGTPGETGVQRRWKDDGKGMYGGHGGH